MNMRKITITLSNESTRRFQVIGRGHIQPDGSKQDFSTGFYANNQAEFDIELNKLKNEYLLFKVVMGKNSKDQIIVQLT
jgi:hypothetical protein